MKIKTIMLSERRGEKRIREKGHFSDCHLEKMLEDAHRPTMTEVPGIR